MGSAPTIQTPGQNAQYNARSVRLPLPGTFMTRPQNRRTKSPRPAQTFKPARLRIVAGEFRGRKVVYNGDPITRPMKERTRESVFSLLGGYLDDCWVVDLFAGTGILAFESVSRGARQAVLFEMARTAVTTIIQNAIALDLSERIQVHNVDTLRWLRDVEKNTANWPSIPWIVFCCPPYRMWLNDTDRLVSGLERLFAISPPGSQLVCETESSFDVEAAMPTLAWDVRHYSPATIAISQKSS